MSRPSRRRSTVANVTGSRRQLGPATTTTILHDRTPSAGAHTGAETVLALAPTVVGLEGALHGEAPWRVVVEARDGTGPVFKPVVRIRMTSGSGGARIRDRGRSGVRESLPGRPLNEQADSAGSAVWITPCGAASRRCTVHARPTDSGQGQAVVADRAPLSLCRRPRVAPRGRASRERRIFPTATSDRVSGPDRCTFHTCGRACGNRC